jgi:putative ABC transport system permease protein
MTQAEQPSNQLLQSDLEGNKPFAVVMPALFLGAAALAVSLVLARWVQAQRGQVGYLRATGFPARAVLLHYLPPVPCSSITWNWGWFRAWWVGSSA